MSGMPDLNDRERNVIWLYQHDEHLRAIAEEEGISHESVRQILIREGIELRGRGHPVGYTYGQRLRTRRRPGARRQ
jgi:DNA-directed RNA polymerase sigma subunit (sigma70/sigma32)